MRSAFVAFVFISGGSVSAFTEGFSHFTALKAQIISLLGHNWNQKPPIYHLQ